MGFLKRCYGEFYGIIIGFLWNFYGISMMFYDTSMGGSIEFLWDVQGISIMFL